jgi:hypothetical protein
MFAISDWSSLNFNSVTDHTPRPQSHQFGGKDSRTAELNLEMFPQGAFCLQHSKCKKTPKDCVSLTMDPSLQPAVILECIQRRKRNLPA